MFLADPPPTQGELHFSFFGIPVRVHPLFWLIGVVLVFPSLDAAGGLQSVLSVLVPWMTAFFLAILIHELGHALAMRRYGYFPSITLYGMGGFTTSGRLGDYRSRGSTTLSQIFISVAGPGAGFLLAGFVIAAIVLSGHEFQVRPFPDLYAFNFEPLLLARFLDNILWISIFWGLLNLMPVYPLDGGQIAREILLAINPGDGIRQSLLVSVAAGIALVLVALAMERFFMAFFFGYLAYSSYATLQAYSGGRWR